MTTSEANAAGRITQNDPKANPSFNYEPSSAPSAGASDLPTPRGFRIRQLAWRQPVIMEQLRIRPFAQQRAKAA